LLSLTCNRSADDLGYYDITCEAARILFKEFERKRSTGHINKLILNTMSKHTMVLKTICLKEQKHSLN